LAQKPQFLPWALTQRSSHMAATMGSIQGKLLNDLEFFRDRQPSVENMARFVHRRLFDALEGRGYPLFTILQSEIKIWESETAWASYVFP
jgi:6-pyruvoyl-tetrahydropterin synthase